ncbi:hypothetical protein ENBRE01_0708 [Enteropsectra breve]|nr:hypothetical protein ENBRE01_0708 [Enteropsectra breve]
MINLAALISFALAFCEDTIVHVSELREEQAGVCFDAMCRFFEPALGPNFETNDVFFRCPKCRCTSHILCFIKSSHSTYWPCPNAHCSMSFEKHIVRKMFGQLFYLYVQYNLDFKSLIYLYKIYNDKEEEMNHEILMEILIDSHMIPDFSRNNNWAAVHKYFQTHELNDSAKFDGYAKIFCDEAYINGTNNEKLQDYGKRIYFIQKMAADLKCYNSPMQFLKIYEQYIRAMNSMYLRPVLSSYYLYYFLANPNTLQVLENIYYEKYRYLNLSLAEKKDDILEKMMDSVFNHCNRHKNMEKIIEYLKADSRGYFVPKILRYIQCNLDINEWNEVLAVFFSNPRPFRISDTLNLVKIAARNRIMLKLECVLIIMRWVNANWPVLNSDELKAISYFLRSSIIRFRMEKCYVIEEYFIENYTMELAKVYVRCMPRLFTLESYVDSKIRNNRLNVLMWMLYKDFIKDLDVVYRRENENQAVKLPINLFNV